MNFRRLSFLSGCVIALFVTGCGGEKKDIPKTVPVTIKISYHGQPLAGANVLMVPQESGARGASGVTDANGAAEMALPGLTKGVVPGRYRIAVSKVESSAIDAATSAEEFYKAKQQAAGDPAASAPKQVLPVKYANAQTSGLECTVTEDPNQVFEFTLSD